MAWIVGMSAGGAHDALTALPLPATGVLLVLADAMVVCSVGVAQWLVRAHAARARWWVGASATAWLVAVPLVFVASAFVAEGDSGVRIAATLAPAGLAIAWSSASSRVSRSSACYGHKRQRPPAVSGVRKGVSDVTRTLAT